MSKLNKELAKLDPNFKLVKAKFFGSIKKYHYKTVLDVKVGDYAVVLSPHAGYAVVEIVEVIPAKDMEELPYELKWLVDKVDFGVYELCEEATLKAKEQLGLTTPKKSRL